VAQELPLVRSPGSALADGAVTNVKLAGYPWGNADLKTDTARLNLLANGGFEVWQRGAGAFVNGYCADRWRISGALQVTKAPYSVLEGKGAWTAQLNTTSGATFYFVQDIEDYKQLQGRPVTFSILATCSVASAIRCYCYDGTTEYWGAYHSGNGTYQTLTLTVTIPVGRTALMFGLTGAATTGTQFYVDNAMLVVGTQAADFAPLPPADELARCNRYYQRFPSLSAAPRATGCANGTNRALVMMPLKTMMGGQQTVTNSGWSDFGISTGAQAVAISVQNGIYQTDSHLGFDVTTVTAPLTVGHGAVMYCANGTGWMAAEWNP
jgi:hypothetical protein